MKKRYIVLISLIFIFIIAFIVLSTIKPKIDETKRKEKVMQIIQEFFPDYELVDIVKTNYDDETLKSINPGEKEGHYKYDIYFSTDKSLDKVCVDIRKNYSCLHENLIFDDNYISLGYIVINNEHYLQVSKYDNCLRIYDNDCNGDYSVCKYTNGKPFGTDCDKSDYYDDTCSVHEVGHQIYVLDNGIESFYTEFDKERDNELSNNKFSSATDNKNDCLKKAQSELDNIGGHSQTSLRMALKYYGYSDNDIDYALNNVNADWNKQAKQYCSDLYSMGYTYQEAYRELVAYGFTVGQAESALNFYY